MASEKETRVETPTNLAEKLRERARRCWSLSKEMETPEKDRLLGKAQGLTAARNEMIHAIPPEVWGRKIARVADAKEREKLLRPIAPYNVELEEWRDLKQDIADDDAFIATYCPRPIQQQHGWEPRREESSSNDD